MNVDHLTDEIKTGKKKKRKQWEREREKERKRKLGPKWIRKKDIESKDPNWDVLRYNRRVSGGSGVSLKPIRNYDSFFWFGAQGRRRKSEMIPFLCATVAQFDHYTCVKNSNKGKTDIPGTGTGTCTTCLYLHTQWCNGIDPLFSWKHFVQKLR